MIEIFKGRRWRYLWVGDEDNQGLIIEIFRGGIDDIQGYEVAIRVK